VNVIPSDSADPKLTMNLLDLISRPSVPVPWAEGDNIPWNDPDFSKRMLKEHLSQDHHAASRRFGKIQKQVNWIHHRLLSGHPTRILDLACGPGLYTSRLSGMGHECVGIDYSPASIAYAADQARRENLRCSYLQQDIRTAEYSTGFGLVMLVYGEFNVFRPVDARKILGKAHGALDDNGLILLEPHTFAAIRKMGEQGNSWYSSKGGLFSKKPHLCLEERFWDSASRTATIRYFVIHASTADVTGYAQTFQAYTNAEYQSLLIESDFKGVEFFSSLTGVEDESQTDLMAIAARKNA
jgi:SAM-dependent methyltransferase